MNVCLLAFMNVCQREQKAGFHYIIIVILAFMNVCLLLLLLLILPHAFVYEADLVVFLGGSCGIFCRPTVYGSDITGAAARLPLLLGGVISTRN